MPLEDLSDAPAKVAFDFKYEASDSPVRVNRMEGEDLLRKRIDATAGFARSHGTEDRDAGEQATFWQSEPVRMFGRAGRLAFVNLTDDDRELLAVQGSRIRR